MVAITSRGSKGTLLAILLFIPCYTPLPQRLCKIIPHFFWGGRRLQLRYDPPAVQRNPDLSPTHAPGRHGAHQAAFRFPGWLRASIATASEMPSFAEALEQMLLSRGHVAREGYALSCVGGSI